MQTPASVVAFFSLVGTILAPIDALAQSSPSVTGILGTVQLCEPLGSNCSVPTSNPTGVLANSLNYADCEQNLSYEFELGIANPSESYALETWAGSADCSQLANRQTSATAVCWPVSPPLSFNASAIGVNVRAQDIAASAFSPTSSVIYNAPAGASACQAQVQTAPKPVTLFMFFVDAQSNPVGTVQQYPINLDLRAGDVQGPITLTSIDSALIVNIPKTSDPDTQGYNVYCDPPPSAKLDTSVDAGSSDAGNSQVPVETCSASSVLAAGVPADGGLAAMTMPPTSKYLCGQGGALTGPIVASGLSAGVHYNIAVAATDAVGNVGPLSNVACGTPQRTPGDVAVGGGVSCDVSSAGAPAGIGGMAILLGVAAVASGLRRRKVPGA